MIGNVYMIRAGSHAIKIGFTKGDPEKRLRQLQTASFEKLSLVAHFAGSVEQEQLFHKVFSDIRLSGEWFRPDPILIEAFLSVAKYAEGITARPAKTKAGIEAFSDFVGREGVRRRYPDGCKLSDYDFDEVAQWP